MNATALHLAPGSHTVQVRVTNLRGAFTNFPDTPVPFTIDPTEPAPPTGEIETVAGGATITAITTVKGYVYAPTLRVLSARRCRFQWACTRWPSVHAMSRATTLRSPPTR